MEFREIVQRRRMVRSFLDRPVDAGSVDRVLDCARGGHPLASARGSNSSSFEGPEQTGRYWDATFPPESRHDFEWAGLQRAPLIIVPLAHKQAYLDRYAEADKGWFDKDEAHWPVPYWLVVTSFAALVILLAVVDEGLGSVSFGIQEGGFDRFRQAFSVPDEYSPIGPVAIGYPALDNGPASSPTSTRSKR